MDQCLLFDTVGEYFKEGCQAPSECLVGVPPLSVWGGGGTGGSILGLSGLCSNDWLFFWSRVSGQLSCCDAKVGRSWPLSPWLSGSRACPALGVRACLGIGAGSVWWSRLSTGSFGLMWSVSLSSRLWGMTLRNCLLLIVSLPPWCGICHITGPPGWYHSCPISRQAWWSNLVL